MHYQSKNSPELDFGAEPRVVEPVFADEVERNLEAVALSGPGLSGTGTAWDEASRAGDTSGSPKGEDWVGPWNSEAIPLRHTFVHFDSPKEQRAPKFLRMPTY